MTFRNLGGPLAGYGIWAKPWRMSRNGEVTKREMRRAFQMEGLECGPGVSKYQPYLERFWVLRSAIGQEICILRRKFKWFWCVSHIWVAPFAVDWHCLPSKLSHTYCPGCSSGPPGPSPSCSQARLAVRQQAGLIGVSGSLYRETGKKALSLSFKILCWNDINPEAHLFFLLRGRKPVFSRTRNSNSWRQSRAPTKFFEPYD